MNDYEKKTNCPRIFDMANAAETQQKQYDSKTCIVPSITSQDYILFEIKCKLDPHKHISDR